MKWIRYGTRESGLSLVEVLAALVILSVVSLALTSFFTNALTYAKGNQSKTVMVNLARNALFYMEKQPFAPIDAYFSDAANTEITCGETCSPSVSQLVDRSSFSVLQQVLNPSINGVQYKVSIIYQRSMHEAMLNDSDDLVNLNEPERDKMAKELLPVVVKVVRADGKSGARNTAEVEGYIASERVR
jgi:prepilin-type N-terminal cleavage/methylation domain-containing protein